MSEIDKWLKKGEAKVIDNAHREKYKESLRREDYSDEERRILLKMEDDIDA